MYARKLYDDMFKSLRFVRYSTFLPYSLNHARISFDYLMPFTPKVYEFTNCFVKGSFLTVCSQKRTLYLVQFNMSFLRNVDGCHANHDNKDNEDNPYKVYVIIVITPIKAIERFET